MFLSVTTHFQFLNKENVSSFSMSSSDPEDRSSVWNSGLFLSCRCEWGTGTSRGSVHDEDELKRSETVHLPQTQVFVRLPPQSLNFTGNRSSSSSWTGLFWQFCDVYEVLYYCEWPGGGAVEPGHFGALCNRTKNLDEAWRLLYKKKKSL